MRRLSTAVFSALLLLSCAACGSRENPAPDSEASAGLFAMDTYLSLTAYGENAETALEQAQNRIRELEGLWSVTDEHSEIYAANHSGGEAVTVSEDTARLVRCALDMAEQTDGALEPTLYPVLTAWGFTTDRFQIPGREELDRLLEQVDYTKISLEGAALTVPDGMQLDLGAVGKGYAADETAAVLRENGVTSALLDFGGNILTVGTKPDGSPWRVGVRDPDSEGSLGVLELTGQGVSVSGGYEKYFVGEDGERYWHILDPATGAPARSGLVQTAVVSGESKQCDALSTALFVMGLDGAIQYWQEHRDFEMVLLAEDRTVYITEGLSHVFSLAAGQEGREVQVIRREAYDWDSLHYSCTTRELPAEVDGHAIYGEIYIPDGAGDTMPAVIFFHGYGGTHSTGAPYARALAEKGFVVYCYDFRGGSNASRSDGSPLDMSVFTEKADLEAVLSMIQSLDYVDRERIFLMGTSQGGMVSAMTGAAHPEEVQGMMLLYPAFCIPDNARAEFSTLDSVPDRVSFFSWLTVGRRYVRDVWDYDVYADISSYGKEVLILHGDRDGIVDLSYSQKAVEVYPAAELKVIEGAGPGEGHRLHPGRGRRLGD